MQIEFIAVEVEIEQIPETSIVFNATQSCFIEKVVRAKTFTINNIPMIAKIYIFFIVLYKPDIEHKARLFLRRLTPTIT